MISTLIEVFFDSLLGFLFFWAMYYFDFPAPARIIVTMFIVVLAVLVLLHQFLPVAGLTPTLRR